MGEFVAEMEFYGRPLRVEADNPKELESKISFAIIGFMQLKTALTNMVSSTFIAVKWNRYARQLPAVVATGPCDKELS